jgi:peptidylprolyl isomerase
MICTSLALTACGDDDSSAESGDPDGGKQAATAPGDSQPLIVKPPNDLPTQVKLARPVVQPPDTLPTRLVIRDISKGAGPAARKGDGVGVEYHGVNKAGKEVGSSWDNPRSFQFRMKLGRHKYTDAFEEGFEGMKVGARRELRIPARLTEGLGTLFYVVDLLEINRKGKCWWARPLGQEPPSLKKGNKFCESRVRVL